MRARRALTGVLLCGLLVGCTSHEAGQRRREPDGPFLLRPDEAPDPVPPGVEMWVDASGMDFEVDGVRKRVIDFGPEPPGMDTHGDPAVHALTRTELDKRTEPDPVLVVHVDPTTPAGFLGHALYHTGSWSRYAYVVETKDCPRAVYARGTIDGKGEKGLFSTLHVEAGPRGTTAQWHAPNTGPAIHWEVNAPLDDKACAELPSRAAVRAALADRIAEGCEGATISPLVHFDRSITISRELPSGVVIQTLAALAQGCRADTAPWLMTLTDGPVAEACEPGWSGETHDYGWFRDETLRRARIDLDEPPTRVWPELDHVRPL